ncbi:nitroreductase family deazaflavin-dependent oxidoreductase [Spongisporangium articulatum]|uniref:Nitroreductase family deazaflavin-dependent oxidoreductase n=1 Tax=Spongisporangium articulatum TaxID=3362603 RepID=A0ABW8AVC4_9ACTN
MGVTARVVGAYRGAIGRIAATRYGSQVFRRVLPPVDRALVRLTKGRANFTDHVIPTLMLTMTGRRSGRPVEQALCYVRDDAGELVVVGTNWGGADHPLWTENLLADADAWVLVRGERTAVRAEPVTGAERDRLYDRFERMAVLYTAYKGRMGERVPRVFRLVPR